jgi:signal transduction histidine kinase
MEEKMGSAKIMIVEDNTLVAEDCRDCLECLGYTVSSVVASGEESVEKAETERPDAVLMDIHLRDQMDGIDAAEQIYTHFEIPVVFLSAYSDRQLLERAKRVGSFGYLVKPFQERELFATLEMTLYKANAEKERRQMEDQLRQAQKMAAIGALAGGIAHHFNNALSIITGNIDMLEVEFAENKKLAHYAQIIRASALRMSELTTQLLTFARAGEAQVQTISLNEIVTKTLILLKPTLDPAIQVNIDLPVEAINVKADPSQMQMVLSAVLTNAAEAIEEDGCISISCKRKRISKNRARDFPGFKPGDYACLTITDDGAGMDEETRKRVFEIFFTTKFIGRGLGLSTAFTFVKNNDGYIWVDSELDQGTTVTIYLLMGETPSKQDAKPTPRTECIDDTS